MAKYANPLVMDAALTKVATGVSQIVCTAEPATRAAAIATALATASMAPGLGGVDYIAAAGDISGRKVTMTAKTSVSVAASGTATHVAIIDGSILLYVTTCTSQVLTAGNTVTIPTWKIEISNPA